METRSGISAREAQFMANKDIWNVKLTAMELDFYKPKKETIASWVSEVERRMGSLRFHPAWGRACTNNDFMVWKNHFGTIEERKAA